MVLTQRLTRSMIERRHLADRTSNTGTSHTCPGPSLPIRHQSPCRFQVYTSRPVPGQELVHGLQRKINYTQMTIYENA